MPHSPGYLFILGMSVGMKFRIDITGVHVDIRLFYPFMVLAHSDPEQTIAWVRTERGNDEKNTKRRNVRKRR
jgi:hypothetical protein